MDDANSLKFVPILVNDTTLPYNASSNE